MDVDYIVQKQSLLGNILENTKEQTRAIESDQIDDLEALIAKRGALMEQVDKLDQAMDVPTDGLTEGIKDLLGEIITIDNANQSLMNQGLESVKMELRKVRIGRQQGENYGPEYGTYKEEGIFFDTKE